MSRRKEDSPDYQYMVSVERIFDKKIREEQRISMDEMRTLRDAHLNSLKAAKERGFSDEELASHQGFSQRLSDVISKRERVQVEIRKIIRAVDESAMTLGQAMEKEKKNLFKSITQNDLKKIEELSKNLEKQIVLYNNGSYSEEELAKKVCDLINKSLGKMNQIAMFSVSGSLNGANSLLLRVNNSGKKYSVEPSLDMKTISLSGLMTNHVVESLPSVPKSRISASDLLAMKEKLKAKQESGRAEPPRDEVRSATAVWKQRTMDVVHESTPKHKIYTTDTPIPAEESHYYTWDSSDKKLVYFESSESEGQAIEPSTMKRWQFNKQLDDHFKAATSSGYIDLLPAQLEQLMKIGGLEVPQLSDEAKLKK